MWVGVGQHNSLILGLSIFKGEIKYILLDSHYLCTSLLLYYISHSWQWYISTMVFMLCFLFPDNEGRCCLLTPTKKNKKIKKNQWILLKENKNYRKGSSNSHDLSSSWYMHVLFFKSIKGKYISEWIYS